MRVELIATDGEIQKKILWFSVTSNGVYSGFCDERDSHISYHFDGNVFTDWDKKKPKRILPTLKDLKSPQLLYALVFTSKITEEPEHPLYDMKKLDAIVTIDTRAYKNGIGVNFYILPQNRVDLLNEITEFPPDFPPKIEAHFFFNCNPWIGLILFGDCFYET